MERDLRPRIPLVKPLLDSLLESSKPQENLFPFGVIAPKTSSWDHISREASHILIYLYVCKTALRVNSTLLRVEHFDCRVWNRVHHSLKFVTRCFVFGFHHVCIYSGWSTISIEYIIASYLNHTLTLSMYNSGARIFLWYAQMAPLEVRMPWPSEGPRSLCW